MLIAKNLRTFPGVLQINSKLKQWIWSNIGESVWQKQLLYNTELLAEEDTSNTIDVVSLIETHEYVLLERGVSELNNGRFFTK